MLCDALGLPVKFVTTPGYTSDCTQALTLLQGETASYVIADKGYDSDEIIAQIERMGSLPVIPSKMNRKHQRKHDVHIYKERNLIERLFNRLKQFRKLATRYEKYQINFEALIYLASTMLWLQ
jgi:transposase